MNIKFGEKAKFLEARPIKVIVMTLNVERCNGKKKKNRFKVTDYWRGRKERKRNYDFLI